jgi:hypothetical protein
MSTILRTEFPFTLPRGYVDSDGTLHREGMMRLATAADEILPLKDPRVQANPAYLAVIVLARVITRLGSLSDVNPKTIEGLFASDLAYLQDLYNRINGDGSSAVKAICPKCEHTFEVEVNGLGGD